MFVLSSHEALTLTANFAYIAERMRVSDSYSQSRAALCEAASRVAFMRAHTLAKQEEVCPAFGQFCRPAASAIA